MNGLRVMGFGLWTQGAMNAEKAEQPSCLRETLFPLGVFASWWLLYFF